MVIPQPPSQPASGLRVGGPFLHALRVAQRGQAFRQVNKALTLAPQNLEGSPLTKNEIEPPRLCEVIGANS